MKSLPAVFAFIFFLAFMSSAETKKNADAGDSITERKKTLEQLKQKLAEEKKKQTEKKNKEKSIMSQLERMEKQLETLCREEAVYEKNLVSTAKALAKASLELQETRSRLMTLNENLDLRLNRFHRFLRLNQMRTVWSDNSVRYPVRIRLIKAVIHEDADLKKKTEVKEQMLEEKETRFKKQEARYLSLKKLTADKQSQVEKKLDEKNKLLAQVRTEKESCEQAIDELREASTQLGILISRLEAQKKTEEEERKFSELDFAEKQGRLIWPVEGKILKKFGWYRNQNWNIDVLQEGIEIEAQIGQQVRAVAEGIVVHADWVTGYGKMVIIDHGNTFQTIYGHLSEIDVRVKQRVMPGDIIGRAGDTGSLEGVLLHFEIRKASKPIDPQKWLKSARSGRN